VAAICRRHFALSSENRVAISNQHLYLFLLLTYLVLPPVSRKQIQSLDCVDIGQGSYLQIDTSIDCKTAEYKLFRVACSLFLIVYLSIPLTWLLILWRSRALLCPTSARDVNQAVLIRNSHAGLVPLRFLFESYKPSSYFFETIEGYRRILFIGFINLISPNTLQRSAFGVFAALCSTIFYREQEPFLKSYNNVLVYTALHVTLIVYATALAIETDLSPSSNSFTFGLILVAINLSVVVLAIGMASARFLNDRRARKEDERRRATNIEWACHFSTTKFNTTLEAVSRDQVSASNILAFYYCSMEEAQHAILNGVPVSERIPGGIIFSLMGPHDSEHPREAKALFSNTEAVLVCSIPRVVLMPLQSICAGASNKAASFLGLPRAEVCEYLRVVPSSTLEALRPQIQGLSLPVGQILRAYKLVDGSKSSVPTAGAQVMPQAIRYTPNAWTAAATAVTVPETIGAFLDAMSTIRRICSEKGVVPLYHFTQPAFAKLIIKSGLRMSTQGQGDGGVYFSTLGPMSYGLGSGDYETNLIIDCFGEERLEEYRGKHMLDVCLVYGAEVSMLARAPGGRDNAFMVSKAVFKTLSIPDGDGNFYLRPDRIFGAFHLNDDIAGYEVENEAQADETTKQCCLEYQVAAAMREAQVKNTLSNLAKLRGNIRDKNPQVVPPRTNRGFTVGSIELSNLRISVSMKERLKRLSTSSTQPLRENTLGSRRHTLDPDIGEVAFGAPDTQEPGDITNPMRGSDDLII